MDPDPYFSLFTSIMVSPFNWRVLVKLVVLILLLIISAIISGSETAFSSLSANDIEKLNEQKDRKSKQTLGLLLDTEKLLATIIVAGSFVNISIILLYFFISYQTADLRQATAGTVFIQIFIIVFVLLLFGQIIPKVYAARNSLKISILATFPLIIMGRIFYPFVMLLSGSADFVQSKTDKKPNISIDDLSNALEISSDAITENENILKGIVKFGNIDVHTIMTPRIDVETVDMGTKFSELIALINESGYSRIPVYEESHDNVKGILYVKDLLPYTDQTDEFYWQKLIRNAYFVPENKKIDDLLKEFQEMKTHMAIIINEYGGMIGIVTLEDILEEIVGDIADESDDDQPAHIQMNDHTYLFDAKVLLNDFYRIMHLDDMIFDDIKGDADTLAGIILELQGEIPVQGDCIDYKQFSFCIESMDNLRIKQIKVVINETHQ